MQKDDNINNLLRESGLRATKPRWAILSYLAGNHRPHTIADITKQLRDTIDVATIYRTIEGFVQAGLVQEINLGAGRVHYEYRDAGHAHHHIVCTSCGDIEDTLDCRDELLEEATLQKSKKFTHINAHALEFFGTCNACA